MYWAEYYHSSQFYMESAKNWGRFLIHTHTSTDPLSGCMVHLSLAMGSTWKWPLSLDPLDSHSRVVFYKTVLMLFLTTKWNSL